jgi:hypothetical protein
MAEVAKPQEMVTPYRPAVPLTQDNPWSDAAPLVEGAASARGGGYILPAATIAIPVIAPVDAPGPTEPDAPPVQDPLGDTVSDAIATSEEEEEEEPKGWRYLLLVIAEDAPYWLGSLVFHLVLFVLLSLGFNAMSDDESSAAVAAAAQKEEAVDSLDEEVANNESIGPFEMMAPPVPPDEQVDQPPAPPPPPVPPKPEDKDKSPRPGLPDGDLAEPVTDGSPPMLAHGPPAPSPLEVEGPGMKVELGGIGVDHSPKSDMMLAPLKDVPMTQGVLGGRGDDVRGDLAIAAGGSPGSERAVGHALDWLANHQLPDGGWSFNHTQAASCKGQCRNAGSATDARNAATAIALLPFLGAGQTHQSGKYKKTVARGLDYLLEHMKDGPEGVPRAWNRLHRGEKLKQAARGATFFEPTTGRMYSHGLGSIALCEAYAMSHDKDLKQPAQEALDFICFAQDPNGGGWRYRPQEAGDTSMVGWQLMALKSGHMAYLKVPDETTAKAMKYLDNVSTNDGANYGYTGRGAGDATTAIGLLCRMYLGWKKDNPALVRGVEWLSNRGPSRDNMYYNYYATQVMRHWEGELWRRWNMVMRDQLTDSQAREGHEAGSWFFPGSDHGAGPGGRLYFTALAAMTLEIYYRFLPLYRTQSVEDK